MELIIEICPVGERAAALLQKILQSPSSRTAQLSGPNMTELTLSFATAEDDGDLDHGPSSLPTSTLFCSLLPSAEPPTQILGSHSPNDASCRTMRVVGSGDHVLYMAATREELVAHWRSAVGARITSLTGFRDDGASVPGAGVLTAVEDACRQLLKNPPAPLSGSVFCVDAGDSTLIFEF